MGTLKIAGVTHWSIPVNNLKESENFYSGLLGLAPVGAPQQQRDVLLQCR
jgi:hypothetical protein